MDILQNQWSPIYDVAAILTSIQVNIYICTTVDGFCFLCFHLLPFLHGIFDLHFEQSLLSFFFYNRSHCSVILIRILLRTRKLHECSAKANVSTTEESARLLNKAGLLTSYIVFVVERLSSSTLNLIPLSCFIPPTLLSLSLFFLFF